MEEKKKYVLKVQRGEELNLHRLDKISDKESIMRPSYEKAMRALMRIMRQTKRFHLENHDSSDAYALENLLFGYSGNIIAFAAPRGGGKTATMLSFSEILAKGFSTNTLAPVVDNRFLNDMKCEQEEQPDAWMARCCFLPLTPVAPAVLEGEQNILNVVWSRLYRYAERLLSDRSRSDRIKEVQKNEIRRYLQNVLSGIKGIKEPGRGSSGDLASMQDVCDGLSLSRHFHMLVQSILKLAVGDHNVSDRYLVIQLDDADSKMQRVYEVLEDVRKYLMIPNLVILMSVDQNCMSDVVFQDNLNCFPDLIKIDQLRLSQDLSRISNKYIDKLIPPTHMIQLPLLNQVVIQWGDMLRLKYVYQGDKDVYEWMEKDKLELETAILMLIYRKTGILFVKPGHYLHNMVPRTLRGFGQLLSHLDSMPDIPALDFREATSVEKYAEAVLKQSEIAAINQRRFEDYFKYRWINVKITNLEDQDFLRKFADSVSANRIRLAVKHLDKCYAEKDKDNKSLGYFDFNDHRIQTKEIKSREDLDHLMWELDRIHRTERDFLLMFAIRTMFTLDSHQHILKQKRESARAFLKYPQKQKILVFDLSPERIRVPESLPFNKNAEKTLKKVFKDDNWIRVCSGVLTPLLDSERISSSIYDMECTDPEIIKLQKVIHRMQDLAVMLYANCDATYEVRKYLDRHMRALSDFRDPAPAVAIMDPVLSLVNSINDGMLNPVLSEVQQERNRYWNILHALSKLAEQDLAELNKQEYAANHKPSDRSTPSHKESCNLDLTVAFLDSVLRLIKSVNEGKQELALAEVQKKGNQYAKIVNAPSMPTEDALSPTFEQEPTTDNDPPKLSDEEEKDEKFNADE